MNHNEKGMTLLEILASIVILSIVIISIFSIMNSTSKQQKEQIKEVQQIQSGAYILKQITKDLRKSNSVDDITGFVIFNNDINPGNSIKYEYKKILGELYRNDILIGTEIEDFSIIPDGKRIEVNFKINGEDYQTSIYLR